MATCNSSVANWLGCIEVDFWLFSSKKW